MNSIASYKHNPLVRDARVESRPELDRIEAFSVPQTRKVIAEYFEHREWIYWLDMVGTAAVGYTAAGLYMAAANFTAQQAAWYLIAGFALFRLGSFIHEIVHMPGKTLIRFRVGWNLIAGIPMLMPSFFYTNHIDHHSTNHYGTGQDGEYLPIGSGTFGQILKFYLQVIFLPAFIFVRFFVVTPLSFFSPRLRQWALEHWSSFVINLRYRQRVPANAPRKLWGWIEFACWLRCIGMVAAPMLGVVPYSQWVKLYAIAIVALGLNYVRNLVAHRYESEGEAMSHAAQLADSVNIRGMPVVTELFFPLNLRYHALHHLFPTLPYHNLPAAHRKLMRELPPDSLYRQSEYPGFAYLAWGVLRRSVARSLGKADRSVQDRWLSNRRELIADWDRRVNRRGRPEKVVE